VLSPLARRALAIVLLLSGAAAALVGARRLMERQRTATEVTRLRDGLYRARAAADRCRGALANSQASLEELDLVVDSMRARVDSFETLDARGVPEAEYDEYLETFEGYNDSVAAWEARATRLRAVDASCRTVIRRHNALSDSLRRVLAEAGIETG
jgi:hypothetical protein